MNICIYHVYADVSKNTVRKYVTSITISYYSPLRYSLHNEGFTLYTFGK